MPWSWPWLTAAPRRWRTPASFPMTWARWRRTRSGARTSTRPRAFPRHRARTNRHRARRLRSGRRRTWLRSRRIHRRWTSFFPMSVPAGTATSTTTVTSWRSRRHWTQTLYLRSPSYPLVKVLFWWIPLYWIVVLPRIVTSVQPLIPAQKYNIKYTYKTSKFNLKLAKLWNVNKPKGGYVHI